MRRLLLVIFTGMAAWGQVGKFTTTPGKMVVARRAHTSTLLKDGRVLLTGGYTRDPRGAVTYLSSAEVFDPATGTFSATGEMRWPRDTHKAVLLKDGRVLVAWGRRGAPVESADSMEIYDPATGTFTEAGPLPREYPFLLPGGEVLCWACRVLADGRVADVGETLKIYKSKNSSLELTEEHKFPTPWGARESVLLADGRLLIVGGGKDYGEITTGESYVYDPQAHKLYGTGLLGIDREDHGVVLLPGGKVLVSGGYSGGGYEKGVCCVPEAEVYDPATGQFSYAGSDANSSSQDVATLLLDGRVLITGERPFGSLYTPGYAMSAANSQVGLAAGGLASLFGGQMATSAAAADLAKAQVLPTTLAGVGVNIRDQLGVERTAKLLYASPAQINFEVPADTRLGGVTIRVSRSGLDDLTAAGWVDRVAPALFTFPENRAAAYGQRVEPGGTLSVVPAPIVLDTRPVYLTLYATGVRNRTSAQNVFLEIDWQDIEWRKVAVEYAGPDGSGIPGLDQLNVRLPDWLRGLGVVQLRVVADGTPSNIVLLDVR